MSFKLLLNIVGLSFNIIGVMIIWKYGLPANLDRDGHIHLVTSQVNESEKILAQKYDTYSKLGMILLILGFVCQLIALLLKEQ
jgi:hypothetical protein